MRIYFEGENLILRFLGSLLKYFIYLFVILIAAGAALFYFETGSWLIRPLAQRAGNFFLSPLKLEIQNVNGSVRNGYSIEGVKLISGDENLLTLDYAALSPDWDLALSGLDGMSFIKSLDVRGISSDLDKVNKLVNHFNNQYEEKDKASSSFNITKMNPVDISIKDVNFGTPFADLKLDEINLDKKGNLYCDSQIISGENILPLKANSNLNFEELKITSDMLIGSKGTGKLIADINNLKAQLYLTALNLEDFMKFLPYDERFSTATGRIDGKIFVESDDGKVKADGIVSMPRANIMDIPLNFRLPFNWNGENVFELENASLSTKVASLILNASVKTDPSASLLKIIADGEAKNISLNEIGKFFAPDMKLKGEGGYLKFNVETVLNETEINKILNKTRAEIEADFPSVSAMNIDIVKALKSHVKLTPKEAPKISLTGTAFGGKLFARGEAPQLDKPQAVVSLVNLDLNTLARTFPEISKALNKPSGKVTLNAKIHEDLDVEGKVTSDKLTLNGITLTNILANINFDYKNNIATLENLALNLGKGVINASGNVNLNNDTFALTAKSENLDPKIIPELKDLAGKYKFNAEASGTYTDINTIKANLNLNANNAEYSGIALGNINAPVTYANNIVKINNASTKIKGGELNLDGSVNIKNFSNPNLDLSASSRGIDLNQLLKAYKLQDNSMPVSGNVSGIVSVKGTLKNASVNATVRAEKIKAGDLVSIPRATIEAKGNTQKITINKLEARINGSEIKGGGRLNINQKNFKQSNANIYANVKHLPLKPLKITLWDQSKVLEGAVDVNGTLTGTIAQPEIHLEMDKTAYYGKTEIKDIKLKLKSPEAKHFVINAGATINEIFKTEADINLRQNGDILVYKVDTKPIDINKAIESQMPSMSGIVKGFAKIKVEGSTKKNATININASSKELTLIDKVKVQNISLPLTFSTAKNKIELKNAKATLSDGVINSNVNIDLNEKIWKGNAKVSHLDIGKLAKPFMPEGEIIGTADAELTAKGDLGIMMSSFANGNFSTSPGYIHKMSIIDRVAPSKKITFEKISGTFFWNGKDLFLNPGTRAVADSNERLYRYFNFNGSMGIPGKNLRLVCDGRFDLKLLDQLLGAMKGVFQYMTGGLANNFLRDAAGRMFGVKRRDFQNVSFTIANSWENPRLLDLKVTKPIEDFLPIDILNKDKETQKEDTQFKLNLKFPAGKGDKSVEEETTEEQFKQQLIDNLFNIGL